MKVAERVLDVTSTLEGESIEMTIDQNALAHIMSVLTDLYSDPELAVIREYSTNAYDAHVEAGITPQELYSQDEFSMLELEQEVERQLEDGKDGVQKASYRPIEVVTPTSLAPYLKVRDFGEGLDADDIRYIYSRYGTSTKRDSADAIGMLGLGCKSALAYTDQFTLRGIKNGISTEVSVSRDEDGSGSMTIVAEYETDELSGVEVIIPAKRLNSMEIKCRDFFSFWPEGTVLLNGEPPARIDGIPISDDILVSDELGQSYIVMGHVPYPVPRGDHLYSDRWNFVAFVKMGEINFTPSREQLQMTRMTKATIQRIKEEIARKRVATFQKLVNEAPDPRSALRLAFKAKNVYKIESPLLYRDKEIPSQLEVPDGEKITIVERRRPERSPKFVLRSKSFSVQWLDQTVWFTGYEASDFSSYRIAKLKAWCIAKNVSHDTRYFLFVENLPEDSEWIDPATVYSWEDVRVQKIARTSTTTTRTSTGRPTGSYDGYVNNKATFIDAKDIDTTKPLFWQEKAEFFRYSHQKVINENYPEHTFILLPKNRIKKFMRDFPMAKDIGTVAYDLAKSWVNSLSPRDHRALSFYLTSSHSSLLRKMDASKIDDPEFRDWIEAAKTTPRTNELSLYRGHLNTHRWDAIDIEAKYPLLTTATRYGTLEMLDHVYLYVNAVYAKEDN